MTQRKPPNMSFPDWVERQILTAQAQGAFDNLPGAGKPIPGLDRPWHDMSWVANYLRRENVDVAALLPPALALAKEIEVLPQRLLEERSESKVREIVEDLNERIRQAHRQAQTVPPVRVHIVNVDAVVEQWTSARVAADDAARTATDDAARVATQAPRTSRRKWFSRSAR